MKKIYTTIVIMMLASFAFAQLTPKLQRIDNLQGEKSKLDKRFNSPTKAGNGEFWYFFEEALENYLTRPVDYEFYYLLQDSNALVHYSDGDGNIPFFSLTQVYDFTDSFWDEAYTDFVDPYTEQTIRVPSLTNTQTFSIDSIAIIAGYIRGDYVPASVIDTLVVTIVANDFDYDRYYRISDDGDTIWRFAQPTIPYDRQSATIPNTGFAKYYTYKLPLTEEDDSSIPTDPTRFQFRYFFVPVSGFQNMTNKQFAISFSYISGTPNRTASSVYFEDISAFLFYASMEPRPSFCYEAPGVIEETNTSMIASKASVRNSSSTFWEKYTNNVYPYFECPWRPGIMFYATCNDCEWSGVKDKNMENKDIIVAPNPATNNFRITLVDDSAAQIELYNLLGQKIYSENTTGSTVSVNVSNFNAGIYLLKVSQNGEIYQSKVVVK